MLRDLGSIHLQVSLTDILGLMPGLLEPTNTSTKGHHYGHWACPAVLGKSPEGI